MEGAYNKVLAARQQLPAPSYAAFMDLLATTVRCERAPASGCSVPLLCITVTVTASKFSASVTRLSGFERSYMASPDVSLLSAGRSGLGCRCA